MDKIRNQLGDGVGILNGLKKNNNSNNNNNHNNHSNEKNNANNNENESPNIEDKVKEFKNKSKKRSIKNTTYGLYEDQIESIREIASALGIGINEFMRESQDMMIDLFKKELDIDK